MWETQGQLAVECGEIFGKTMLVQPRMKTWIIEAGFTDVKEYRFKWPLGPWSNDQRLKDIGRWNLQSWHMGLEGWSMALLTRYKGVCHTPILLLCRYSWPEAKLDLLLFSGATQRFKPGSLICADTSSIEKSMLIRMCGSLVFSYILSLISLPTG